MSLTMKIIPGKIEHRIKNNIILFTNETINTSPPLVRQKQNIININKPESSLTFIYLKKIEFVKKINKL